MGKEQLSFTESLQNLFGKLPIDSNGVCIKEDRLLKVKNKDITSYIVPDSVKVICEEAFSGCKNLSTLEIGESVEKIGNRSIPKKITRLIVKNKNINLSEETFSGMRSSKDKMTVIIKKEKKDSTQNLLEEFARVVSFNDMPSQRLGKNESGQELTYANVEIEIKNKGALLHATILSEDQSVEGEKAEMVLAKDNAPLSIKVYGNDGKIIFQGKDFIVDGNIAGRHNGVLLSYPSHYLAEQWKNIMGKEEEYVDEYVIQNTFRDLSQKDLFSSRIVSTSLYKFIEVNENYPVKIKFKIRMIDGIFNASKLNFIELPQKSLSKNLKEVISDYPYILNLLVYDNDLYSGSVELNLSGIKGADFIKEFKLTKQFIPETFSTKILDTPNP